MSYRYAVTVEHGENHFCACHNAVGTPEGVAAREANQISGVTPAGLNMDEFGRVPDNKTMGDL